MGIVAERDEMPCSDQICKSCGELVKSNNMPRHIKRWHSEFSDADDSSLERTSSSTRGKLIKSATSSCAHEVPVRSEESPSRRGRCTTPNTRPGTPSHTGGVRQSRKDMFFKPATPQSTSSSSPSADYVKDAVLCMLRRVESINIPSLSSYLESHFPEMPQSWRMPVIVAAFTAVQKAAATHGDAVLNADQERAVWAKRSLARWTHGLSAVEPGHMKLDHRRQRSRDSSSSSKDPNSYSPTTNFLLDRDLPISVESEYGKKQFEVDYASRQMSQPINLGCTNDSGLLTDTDVEPEDAIEVSTEAEKEPGPNYRSICTSVAITSLATVESTAAPTLSVNTDVQSTGILLAPTVEDQQPLKDPVLLVVDSSATMNATERPSEIPAPKPTFSQESERDPSANIPSSATEATETALR